MDLGEEFMGRCGTNEACPGCPITVGITLDEDSKQHLEVKRLGAAAERLHMAGWQDITEEGAWAIATSTVDNLEGAPERLRLAVQRIGTSACKYQL